MCIRDRIWTAICEEEVTIEVGAFVIIKAIEGVKLIVLPAETK